jgi:hypothetical protein
MLISYINMGEDVNLNDSDIPRTRPTRSRVRMTVRCQCPGLRLTVTGRPIPDTYQAQTEIV